MFKCSTLKLTTNMVNYTNMHSTQSHVILSASAVWRKPKRTRFTLNWENERIRGLSSYANVLIVREVVSINNCYTGPSATQEWSNEVSDS